MNIEKNTKNTMLMFPGHGSQFLKMGKWLFDGFSSARDVFLEVNESLGYRLSDIIFGEDEELLLKPENSQPAIMCTSIALFRVIIEKFGYKFLNSVKFIAGHSVGEFSALCAAECIDLSFSAKLLYKRGLAIAKICRGFDGLMAAIIGMPISDIKKIISVYGNDLCFVSVDNGPNNVVISGERLSVLEIIRVSKKKGAKLAVQLKTNIPFHSPFVKDAANEISDMMNKYDLNMPILPIISNVTAKPIIEKSEIPQLMSDQVFAMVRWREIVEYAAKNGVSRFIDIGPNNILSNMVKRMNFSSCHSCISLYNDRGFNI